MRPVAKHIAAVAATIGRDFSYELLASVSDVGRDELQNGLNQLVERILLGTRLWRPIRPAQLIVNRKCLLRQARRDWH